MTAEPLSVPVPGEPEGDPTLDLLCGQLVRLLQRRPVDGPEKTYQLLAKRLLENLPEAAAERLRQAPAAERGLLAETLEGLLHSDARTRQLVSVILTPPGLAARGTGRRDDGKVRILVVSSQPSRLGAKRSRLPPVRVDEEMRKIQEALRKASLGKQFEVILVPAAQAEDLSWCLLEHEPDIFHFSGHGYQGAILVARGDGSALPITGEQLGRLFAIFKGSRLRCVVLNACQTGLQSEPIAREVGAAVTRSTKVPDQAALVFAEHFYEGLAFGRTLREAFELGCWQAETQTRCGEAGLPQLLGEGREIRFVSAD